MSRGMTVPCTYPSSSISAPDGHDPGADRISETASVLALGLMRLRARKSSRIAPERGESSLHFSAAKSGDPARIERENRE
jgi:hypothetical protein